MAMDGLRVLVLEDDLAVQRLLTRQLGQLGYDATAFSTGEATLQHLADHQYDLLIVDRGLPDMDGLDVIDEVRRSAAGMAVILTSGEGSGGDPGDADLLLSKPFRLDDLRHAIASVCPAP